MLEIQTLRSKNFGLALAFEPGLVSRYANGGQPHWAALVRRDVSTLCLDPL